MDVGATSTARSNGRLSSSSNITGKRSEGISSESSEGSYSDGESLGSEEEIPFEGGSGGNSTGNGFRPLDDPDMPTLSRKRQRDEAMPTLTPEEAKEMQLTLESISALLSQYPDVQLRTNMEQLESLAHLSLPELRNVLTNMLTDIRKIDGSPMGEFFSSSIGYIVDVMLLPGFRLAAMKNEKLQRDIDNLIILKQGSFSPIQNIFFRLVNIGVEVRSQKVL